VTKFDVKPSQLFIVPESGPRHQTATGPFGETTFASRRTTNDWPLLPWPRGPLSALVISALQQLPGSLGATPPLGGIDALRDDDFALALYLCYEVHYRGLADAEWEWDPGLVEYRVQLERVFEDRLRDEVGRTSSKFSIEMIPALDELIQFSSTPSLSTYLSESGTFEQFREFCMHRSAYQLKEDDPRTFATHRAIGDVWSVAEAIHGEGGLSDAARAHAAHFCDTMAAIGLDGAHGSYVENLPGVTLATANLISMFALYRRWRAALVGHLAVFETTSVEPTRRYGQALARFGIEPERDVNDGVPANIDVQNAALARDRLIAGLMTTGPHLGADFLFGAAAVLMLEQRFSTHLLDAWANGRSSLVPWELTTR
jgi:hypothetical protein